MEDEKRERKVELDQTMNLFFGFAAEGEEEA
jgi:hypothetical protein